MRHLVRGLALAMSLCAFSASADTPPKGMVAGVVLDAHSAAPLAGASVILTSDEGHLVYAVLTDGDGRFSIGQLPTGSYQVLFVLGAASDLHTSVPVTDGVITPLHGELAPTAEVTTIIEHPIRTAPRPIASSIRKVLPYSDAAADSDDWEVGWMLLDVDARGQVESFRFLHRPGHDLERIATAEAWRLRFEPARGVDGQPVASQMLWKMEWPSYWWRQEIQLITDRVWSLSSTIKSTGRHVGALQRPGFMGPRLSGDGLPPCRGEALNLGSMHPVLRDCSKPDLAALDSEPRIRRPLEAR